MTGMNDAAALVAAIALLAAGTGTRADELPDSEAVDAYVAAFEQQFPRVANPPPLEEYATAERFDELYMGSALDDDLAAGISNENGGIAWGWSYRMMAYNAMFRATGQLKYLDANARCIRAVLAARDDVTATTVWTGRALAAWSSGRYASRGRAVFAVHTGIIVYPILEWAQLERATAAGERVADASRAVEACLESLAVHDRQWRDGPSGEEGHYIGLDQEDALEGRPLPANRLSAMGRAHWLAWKATGDALHRQRALAIGRYIKSRLTLAEDGAYYWPYALPAEPVVGSATGIAFDSEDISHGSLTMALPILLAEEGEVFTVEDMQRLGRTVTQGFARLGHGVLFGNVQGDPRASPRNVQLPGRWLRLAPFVPEVYERIADFYRIYQPTPSPLGLALLVRYRPAGPR